MKMIINVDEKLICEGFERTFTKEERDILIRAIGNGTPYKERPKGEWIKKVDNVGFVSYICSECGFELELEDCSDSYYCSNCGADMRVTDNDK